MDWIPKLVSVARKGFDVPELRQNDDDVNHKLTETQLDAGTALEHMRATIGEEHSRLLSDSFLLKCLAYQKWNVESAASTATGFLSFRLVSKWPLRVPGEDAKPALCTGLHWLLWPRVGSKIDQQPNAEDSHWTDGTTSDDGGPAACLVFNMASVNPELCPIEQFQKASLFLMESATDNIEVQKRGIALIVDFRGVQFSRFARTIGMDDIKRGMRCCIGSFPCRMRRMWLLGAPSAVRLLVRGVVQMLALKLRQRIRMAEGRNGLEEMAADLSPCIDLPESLGGTNSSFDWTEAINACLKQNDKVAADGMATMSQEHVPKAEHLGGKRCACEL